MKKIGIMFASIFLIYQFSYANANIEKCAQSLASVDLVELKSNRNFKEDRDLYSYFGFFTTPKFEFPIMSLLNGQGSFDLKKEIYSLSPRDSVIDVGAGYGQAAIDLLADPEFKGSVVAIGIAEFPSETITVAARSNDRLRLRGGHTLEQLEESGEISRLTPNGFRLAINLYGSDTYSKQLDKSMEIQLKRLSLGGKLVTLIPTTSYGFNFKSFKPATRIRPLSKRALDATQIEKRLTQYFQMHDLNSELIAQLSNGKVQVDPFPPSDRQSIGEICCGEEFDPATEQLHSAQSKFDFFRNEIGGILGWIEAIKGVKILAASEIPNSGGELGILLVLERTTGPLNLPSLHLETYEFDVGPATRFYTW